MFAESMLMILGSTGFFLMTGVPIAFVSNGGTALMAAFMMAALILYLGCGSTDHRNFGRKANGKEERERYGEEKLLERTKVLLAVILALVVVFCYFLMGRTSAVKGLNTGTDELKKSTLKNMYRQETIEGAIWDGKENYSFPGNRAGEKRYFVLSGILLLASWV